MPYTRKQFARELLAEIDKGYDVIRIARWAFLKKLDTRTEDLELAGLLTIVFTMEEGPEFEYNETELRELAQRILDEEE